MLAKNLLSCLYALFCGIAVAGFIPKAEQLSRRGSESNATLIAYGTHSTGWPIAYGRNDGLLYITQSPDSTDSFTEPLTWDLPSITNEDWLVNGTFANGTAAGSLTISSRANGSDYLGLIETSLITSKSIEQRTMFALFATQLVYNNDTELQAQFWAEPTEYDSTYKLCWLLDNADYKTGSFPVIVKGVTDE